MIIQHQCKGEQEEKHDRRQLSKGIILAQAAITKYQRLCGFNNTSLFSGSLRSEIMVMFWGAFSFWPAESYLLCVSSHVFGVGLWREISLFLILLLLLLSRFNRVRLYATP